MKIGKPSGKSKPGVPKLKLALGAASLFLFIVGVKRSFRMEGSEITESATGPGSAGGGHEEPEQDEARVREDRSSTE